MDQRVLFRAERGDLRVTLQTIPVEWILNALVTAFSTEESLVGRLLEVEAPGGQARVHTDAVLIRRFGSVEQKWPFFEKRCRFYGGFSFAEAKNT